MQTQAAAVRSLVRAEGLSLAFDHGRVRALNGVNMEVHAGEFVALVGPSGCGKSSLLSLIGALDQPSAGALYFESVPYTSIADYSVFRRENIGFVFQSFFLIPTLSAVENILVATVGRRVSRADYKQTALGLLRRLGIENRAGYFPGHLSGGERQRVAIARALINAPRMILADEPTGSLDSVNAAQVLDLIDEVRREQGLTVVMATHDPEVSVRADRVVYLRDGRLDVSRTTHP